MTTAGTGTAPVTCPSWRPACWPRPVAGITRLRVCLDSFGGRYPDRLHTRYSTCPRFRFIRCATLAERRGLDRAHVEPGAQVGAEAAGFHLDAQVAAGSELVEKPGAAVGALETAGPGLIGAAAGTALHTKLLGLDQIGRDRGAVDRDDRLRRRFLGALATPCRRTTKNPAGAGFLMTRAGASGIAWRASNGTPQRMNARGARSTRRESCAGSWRATDDAACAGLSPLSDESARG